MYKLGHVLVMTSAMLACKDNTSGGKSGDNAVAIASSCAKGDTNTIHASLTNKEGSQTKFAIDVNGKFVAKEKSPPSVPAFTLACPDGPTVSITIYEPTWTMSKELDFQKATKRRILKQEERKGGGQVVHLEADEPLVMVLLTQPGKPELLCKAVYEHAGALASGEVALPWLDRMCSSLRRE